MDDWADQIRAELEKQAANRAATLESLFFSSDYEAIRDWLNEWEMEDSSHDSLVNRYQQFLSLLQMERQLNQRQCFRGSGAEFLDSARQTGNI